MQSDATRMIEKNSEIVYADGHCHLVPEWFDYDEVVRVTRKAMSSSVKYIVNSAIEAKHYDFGLKTGELPGVFLSVGLDTTKVTKESVEELKNFHLENLDKTVAIGEIGLDFHWVKEEENRQQQEEFFRELIVFAMEIDKPLVIHSRAAEEKAIQILKEMGAEEVLMHCFGGTEEQAKEISRMSWYITVPTSAVYRKNFQKILQSVALDSLMFETDSPYHSLQKDKQNDPSSIPILSRHASKLLEVEERDLAYITTKNVKDFYRI
ncbi:MAG: TatD family hydrolase [Candidatus Heimdallarchaeota archaeon]|nr:TatD family hydrolase [Candidatus Heimdallarchaeota archaeon]